MKKDWNGRKADQLGTLVSKNDMMVAFLAFLFRSYIPDLELERQQPRPNNRCRKSKGPEKRQPIKTEIFYTIATLLQPKTQEKLWAYSRTCQQRPSGEPICPPSQGFKKVPPHTHIIVKVACQDAKEGIGIFIPSDQ